MKICALTHTYPRFAMDTTGPFVEFLMEELASLGHEVHLLSAWDADYDPDRSDKKVRLHLYRYVIPGRWHILGYSRTIEADVRLKWRMLLLSPLMIIFGTIAFYRLVKRVKPDILQAHWFLPNGFMAAIVARLTGIPLVATLHGSDVFVAEKGGPYRFMTWFTNRTIKRLSSCSPELRDRIAATGFPKIRSRVIPYAVDPLMQNPQVPEADVLNLRQQYGLEGKVLILGLGRLVYKKGFEYAIRALPRILQQQPKAHLMLAGGGDLMQELKQIAATENVSEFVTFTDTLLRDRIPVHMAAADIFIMPSIHDQSGNVDGLPNVILEAMAFGKPVVATDITGIPLAVHDGENGFLVPEKDAASLAEALIRLSQDPELIHRFGQVSKRLIEEQLNWPVIAGEYETLFQEMLAP